MFLSLVPPRRNSFFGNTSRAFWVWRVSCGFSLAFTNVLGHVLALGYSFVFWVGRGLPGSAGFLRIWVFGRLYSFWARNLSRVIILGRYFLTSFALRVLGTVCRDDQFLLNFLRPLQGRTDQFIFFLLYLFVPRELGK